MTAPTREQSPMTDYERDQKWVRDACDGALVIDNGRYVLAPEQLRRFAAFAAGQSRSGCTPTPEQVHAWAEQTQLSHFACYVIPGFGHRLQRFAELAAGQSSNDARPCTCHPDDNPPKPCPRKYALDECRAAASGSGSGAELVREVEDANDPTKPSLPVQTCPHCGGTGWVD